MQSFLVIFKKIIDIIFPEQCAGCGAYGTIVCKNCIVSIPKADPSKHTFITAVFDYKNPVIRSVIWKLKYKNIRSAAKYFGGNLYEEIMSELADGLHISQNETFLLVPIPLHKKRLRERGYNQSELLSRAIMKCDAGNIFRFMPSALARTRATKPQAKSTKRSVRFENLRGAFVANPALVRGKHILLIDDVTTTGATLLEARRTLLHAGAHTVRAYTVAH